MSTVPFQGSWQLCIFFSLGKAIWPFNPAGLLAEVSVHPIEQSAVSMGAGTF
jgi:hypothetical protein